MLVTVQNTAGIVASKNGPVSVSLSYTFPSAGLYYIGFGYVSNFATGLYTLSISCGSSSGGQCRNLGSLAVGSLVSGTLSAATGSCFGDGTYSGGYRFDGTKDVPLVVTYAASYAPYLSVTTDTGDGGSYRQLSFAGTVSVTYIPSYSGSHWLYIGSNTTTAVSGNYSVRIDAAPTTDPCRRRVAGH
jgi:hypothetical protein